MEIYVQSTSSLQGVKGMGEREALSTLKTLVEVLQEGEYCHCMYIRDQSEVIPVQDQII
jgi:hypothetical protein